MEAYEDGDSIFCSLKDSTADVAVTPIMKVVHNNEPRFATEYPLSSITKIVNGIANKNTGKVVSCRAIETIYLDYGLNSRDIMTILRQAAVTECVTTQSQTELRIEMLHTFPNTTKFSLAAFIDLEDRIHLADIRQL